MKVYLLITAFMFLQTAKQITYGTYKQVPRNYNVRHIPDEKLTLRKDGTYKHEYSITSIRAERKILGKWQISEQKIILNPLRIVEGKGYWIYDKKRTNYKVLSDNYHCEQQTFSFKMIRYLSRIKPGL